MNYIIIPTTEEYLNDFWTVLDSIAKERQYLAFLEGPPFEKFYNFVQENMRKASPPVSRIGQ